MKTILLIAALAFSMNVFGQHKTVTFGMQTPLMSAKEKIQSRLLNKSVKSQGFNYNSDMSKGNHDRSGSPLDLIQVLDSLYFWAWDSTNAEWVNEARVIDIVNGSNNLIASYVWEYWNGFSWDKTEKYILTYDANNNIISEVEQSWNG